MIASIDTSLIDWSKSAIRSHCHVSLAVRAPDTGARRYTGHHGDHLLQNR